jgi:DNA repair protein SbcD/Mre11
LTGGDARVKQSRVAMPIEIIHVSDIHFGSGEGHGRINPETGLNVRFEDFVKALGRVVDYAIENTCDVFLFSGDAYRNASPEPIYQKMFARQLKRLSDASVQTILLVGNHDQILKSTSSHALSVFQTLEVPNITIIDRPALLTFDTAHGALQLIGLPHVTRHQMVTNEKYAAQTAASIDTALVENVHALLRGFYDELDETIPTVVTAHMTVDKAVAGIEQELLVGYTLTFPCDIFADSRIDYVALGHVHKHQLIRDEKPTIVYSGSLERVDFGEQKEDKGFVHATVSRGKVDWKFVSIEPRPFVTIETDLTRADDPTEHLCAAVMKGLVPGAVLRVRYKIHQDQAHAVDEDAVRNIARECLSVRFQPDIVVNETRARIPQLTENAVASPLSALDLYLTEVAPDRRERLMERARELTTRIESLP